MASYFLDTGALAKRYLPETGSRWIRRLCLSDSTSMSALTIVEIRSTLARLARHGAITTADRDGVLRRFRSHLREMPVVEIDLQILNTAAALVVQTPPSIPLRSLDAIHLTSAQSFAETRTVSGLDPLTFVSSDTRLLAAAQWAGFPTDDPNNHP